MRTTRRILQQVAQSSPRLLRNYGLIGFHHIDLSASRAEFFWNHIARHLCPDEQHAFPLDLFAQTLHYRLRDILFRNHFHLQAVLHNRLLGRRSDGSDLETFQPASRDAQSAQTLPRRLHSIDAGKNEPVVRFDVLQYAVDSGIGVRFANLNEWDFNHGRT